MKSTTPEIERNGPREGPRTLYKLNVVCYGNVVGFEVCTSSRTLIEYLIKRGGGNWPDEARQPARSQRCQIQQVSPGR